MRQILKMAFDLACEWSDPALFDGSGALQRAILQLHASVDRQIRQIEGAA
jgi:hypothetical protein